MRLPIIVLLVAGFLGLPPPLPSADPEPSAAPQNIRSSFGWPIWGDHHLSRPFQPPSTAYGPGHRGVDLTAQSGQPVLASGDGLVIYAGALTGRDVVSIEHQGGLRTTYEPVLPAVTVGQQVARGQQIGFLEPSHPGCGAPQPHICLHWGAHHRKQYLDPLRLLGIGHVRLLPWDAPAST